MESQLQDAVSNLEEETRQKLSINSKLRALETEKEHMLEQVCYFFFSAFFMQKSIFFIYISYRYHSETLIIKKLVLFRVKSVKILFCILFKF